MSASKDTRGKLFEEEHNDVCIVKNVSVKNVGWAIDSVDLKDKKVGEFLTSPVFYASSAGWQMKIYPKGINTECQDHVSLFLRLVDGSILYETKTMLIMRIGGKSVTGNDTYSVAVKVADDTYGIKKLFEYDLLLQHLNNDNNGICSLKFVIKLEDSRVYLPIPFDTVLNNPNYSDVKFKVEGKEIYAHRVLLASKSNVFAAMFEHNMKENLEGIVEVDDVQYDVMLAMFSYIYTGIIKDIEKIAKPLLIAADKYEIIDLKKICSKYLERHLNIENIRDCLDLAMLYNVSSLKLQAIDFIKRNASKISPNDLKLMMESQPNIIVEIIHYLSKQALCLVSK